MKLLRIIAERFGSLRAATLGELGDGLTVVLGPNEAGKTSFTTLVRYVLYGYPTSRGSEPDYTCDAGDRLGRLVFATGGEQWAIERAEGVRGGPVALHTLSGPDNPDILAQVTNGVSREAFRVVFGFGLDEMVQIETGRGDGVDILSRLYAATAGLDVNPSDIRASLKASAGELWAPGARKRELNLLKARITELKREIADLELRSAGFAQDQMLLAELTDRLAAARRVRDEATSRASEMAAAAQKLQDLEARVGESAHEGQAAQASLALAREKSDQIVVDERIVSIASQLEVVLGDLSAFKAGLRRVAEQKAEAAAAGDRAAAALHTAGVDANLARVADLGPDTTAGVERWRSALAGLESQATTSRRTADSARDAARLTGSETPARAAAPSGTAALLPGALMVLLGIAVAVIGLISTEYIQALLGFLVVGTGAFLVVRSARGSARQVGTARDSGPEFSQSARLAAAQADRDETELAAKRVEWQEWLAARGLDAGRNDHDPAAIAILVGALREYVSLSAEAARVAEGAQRDLAECESYRDRLATLVGGIVPDLARSALDDVPLHAARVRDHLDGALHAHRAKNELALEIEDLETVVAHSELRSSSAKAEHSAVLERWGLSGYDAARLAAEAVSARDGAADATDEYDRLSNEHTALSTRLDAQGREDVMGRLRLELSGVEERRAAARERFEVLAVAEQLMARAQSFNEQARQPAVIQRASELFEMITDGRYARVHVPSDGSAFVVYDGDSRPRPSSELSTGTAQQLYLALRIALIETVGDVGVGLPVFMDDVLVNFDPERKRGAAQAIGHLATHRQVVLFTCHPETAALMEDLVPGHTRLTLDRC